MKYKILGVSNVQRILLTLVPEEPSIPTDVCEELIVLTLSIFRQNKNDETKAQCILYWLLCKYYIIVCTYFVSQYVH